MDVSRFAGALQYLKDDESGFAVQKKLAAVESALQNLAGNPADTNSQVALTTNLEHLSDAISELEDTYDPAQMERIIELGAKPFFTHTLLETIKDAIQDNPMSPASALAIVSDIKGRRQAFIKNVSETLEGISGFQLEQHDLAQGEAEVAFELPREMFDNELRGFIAELRTIQRIIRVFAEIETGSVAEIRLGAISASDPLVFLNTTPAVIASIGLTVSWLLTQWKKFEEIRKIRAEAAKLKSFSPEELEAFFDEKVKSSLQLSIDKRVEEVLSKSSLSVPRKTELSGELAWALEALFARIERGMRIEVMASLPPVKEGASPKEQQVRDTAERVRAVAKELSFPSVDPNPILALPALSEPTDRKVRKKETPKPKPSSAGSSNAI